MTIILFKKPKNKATRILLEIYGWMFNQNLHWDDPEQGAFTLRTIDFGGTSYIMEKTDKTKEVK